MSPVSGPCAGEATMDSVMITINDRFEVSLGNTLAFAMGTGDLMVFMPTGTENSEIDIFDTMGRLVRAFSYKGDIAISIDSRGLNTGLYILRVTTPQNQWSTKLLRLR